jgi:hypothetical protein
MSNLNKSANQFRATRNFFTHLDQALSNPDKHGISGALDTGYGMQYTEATKGAMHIILAGDTLYFTWDGRANAVNVGRPAFDSIFDSARSVYAEILSHKGWVEIVKFPSASGIYPTSQRE